jgi:F-type H+-transporting ATPase subunit b
VQIDWFTFGAQIVNFLILIGLLKRFLYGPILDAMDEREARINARLRKAKEKRAEAEQEADRYRSMQDDLEAHRTEKLAEAEAAAKERRQTLIEEARAEVEYLEQEWREALKRDRASFLEALSERAVEETVAIARRALTDLADADLEAQSLDLFVERLHTLDDEPRQALVDALHAAEGTATVRSAFGLSGAQQDRIRTALRDPIDQDLDLTVETDATLGFGVELRVEDRKVAWTLDGYLSHLVDGVRERLDAEITRAGATPVSESNEAPTSSPSSEPSLAENE